MLPSACGVVVLGMSMLHTASIPEQVPGAV